VRDASQVSRAEETFRPADAVVRRCIDGIVPWPPWRQIVGLRNLLAYGCWVIDAAELWDVARKMVPEFVGELRPLLGDTE